MEKNKIRSLFLTLHKYQADERPQYQTLNGEHDREKLHVGEGFLKRFPKFNKPYPVLTNGAEWNQKNPAQQKNQLSEQSACKVRKTLARYTS